MKHFFIIVCSVLVLANCADPKANKENLKENDKSSYLEMGQKISAITFSTLSKNLQKAMQEGGVSNAVKYCNIAASKLVDSLEQAHNVKIKRSSLKVRNPNNQPTDQELVQLNSFQEQFEAGNQLNPVVRKTDDHISYFAPINVMPLCQKCHGKLGESLAEEDYKVIKDLYPSDQAIGYNTGDLRGMWNISFIRTEETKG